MSLKKTIIAGLLGLSMAATSTVYAEPPAKGNSVNIVKPKASTPSKRNTPNKKTGCEDLYNGQGMCMSESLAKSLGITEHKTGYCSGKARNTAHCYDTTTVPVLKGLEEVLDGQGRFALGVSSANCEADYQRITGKITVVGVTEKAMKAAELELSKYITGVDLKSDDVDSTTTPAGLLRKALDANNPKIDTEKANELLTSFKSQKMAYLSAISELNADVSGVKKNGCAYVEPVKPRSVSIIPYLGGVIDHEGNAGGEVELVVLAPAGKRFGLGGYLNLSLLNHSSETGYEKDLGITIEEINEKTDLRRYLGAGAMLRYDINDWLNVSGKLGVAWMNDELTRDITRFGKTNTIGTSAHEIAFEGAVGLGFTLYKGLEVGLEGRGNTLSGFDGILKVGNKF